MKIHQTYWDTRTKVFTKKEPMGVEMRQSAARLHRMKRKNLSIVDNIFTHKNRQTKWIKCAEGSLRAILITIDIDVWCMLQFITHLPIKMPWNNYMSWNWKHFFFQNFDSSIRVLIFSHIQIWLWFFGSCSFAFIREHAIVRETQTKSNWMRVI